MIEFFNKLFDTTDYPARWNCGNWSEFEGYLHIFSDMGIALAYFAIPIVLYLFWRKESGRTESLISTTFNRIVLLFVMFIAFCGLGHFLDATIFYYPAYRFLGLIKFITAIVSIITAIYLPFIFRFFLKNQLKIVAIEEEREVLQRLTFKAGRIGSWNIDMDNFEEASLKWNKEMKEIFGGDARSYEEFLSYLPNQQEKNMVQASVQECLRTSKPYEADYWIRTPKGENKFIAARGEIYDNRFIGVAIDLTERKKTEDELRRSNEALNDFAYITSHDLKAPLRAINGLANWIEEEVNHVCETQSEDLKKYVDLLKSRSQRMENLINGVLEYSRIGRTDVARERVSLGDLIEEIYENYVSRGNVKIIWPDDMPTIWINRARLAQVFANIIDNSVKYNNKDVCEIVIKYANLNSHYYFEVIDNGPGIDPKYHDKIFKIFQTLQPKDKVESTGVGLTLVKKIVESKGGKIGVENNTDQGVKFWFTIRKKNEREEVGSIFN